MLRVVVAKIVRLQIAELFAPVLTTRFSVSAEPHCGPGSVETELAPR